MDNKWVRGGRTPTIANSLAPTWNTCIPIAVPVDGCQLRLEVLDEDKGMTSDFLGQCEVDIPPTTAGSDAEDDATIIAKQAFFLADKSGRCSAIDPRGQLILWFGAPGQEPGPDVVVRSLVVPSAKGLLAEDMFSGKSDPYCIV
eukprot:SAG31_NODE_7425_length_1691_cov_1.871231_2_plen_143_part_01